MFNKIDDLEVFLSDNVCDVLCVAETWLTGEKIKCIKLDGYRIVANSCRPNQCGGGVMILINELKQVKFSKIDCINALNLEGQFEVCATFISFVNFKVIVMNILYRPPYMYRPPQKFG